MTHVIACGLENLPIWIGHLQQRFAEAIEHGIIAADASVSLKSARVFMPTGFDCGRMLSIDPVSSLRQVRGEAAPPSGGWVARPDLFDGISERLHDDFDGPGPHWLVCEAGPARVGDARLEQRAHLLHRNKPFLFGNIRGLTTDQIADVLRSGRWWRFLGVIVPLEKIGMFDTINHGVFVCDALAGDSLMLARFEPGRTP